MKKKLSPYVLIILSFLSVILIGMLLLKLPFATQHNKDVSWINALFISTSAVTITGLSPVSIYATFTTFGKVVIAVLIQVGGLSITTIALFIIAILGFKLGFGSRMFIKESMNVSSFRGLISILKRVVVLALIVETIGAIVFTSYFMYIGNGFATSLGYGFFHAISSYNNAGFDIFSGNSSIIDSSSNVLFSFTTMILILIGGIGAIVFFEVLDKKSIRKLTVHSKIVLKMTLTLFIFGTVTALLIESNLTLLQAMFHSVTVRTAGFGVIDYSLIKTPTIVITSLLMFIGAAPASTGGGVKVTTFYTAAKGLASFSKQRDAVSYKRKIPNSYIIRAFSIIILSLIIVASSIIIVSIIEPVISLSKISFEVFSSFSNTGLTMGITGELKSLTKLILVIVMFIGRIGVMTIISALFKGRYKKSSQVDYIDSSYILG